MLRQTAYGPPSEFGGLLLGLLLQPPLLSIGSSLKSAQVHPVGGKVPPTAVEAKVKEDQRQVQGREPSKENPRAIPSSSPCGRRRLALTYAPSRSHRECTDQPKTTPTPRPRTRNHQRKPQERNPAPDPAPALRTPQPTAYCLAERLCEAHVLPGPRFTLKRGLLSPCSRGGLGEA